MTAAPPSRDIILGGTGLLGQAIASTLAASGTHVTAVARHEAPAGALPDGVTFRSVDVDTADDGAVTALLAGKPVKAGGRTRVLDETWGVTTANAPQSGPRRRKGTR